MAQLGARLDGIEEVVGSNPIGSTYSLGIVIRKYSALPECTTNALLGVLSCKLAQPGPLLSNSL